MPIMKEYSWFEEYDPSYFERFCIWLLKGGPIPLHIAFIMDGNRRFARKNNEQAMFGHRIGFDALVKVLSWCYYMGVREVTLYAFSIENFKRNRDEVDFLMDLLRDKLEVLIKTMDDVMDRGICISFPGDMSLLSEDLQKTMAKIRLMTASNDKLYLNLCIAYTSRQEICQAVETLRDGDITDDLLESCLFVGNKYEPSLIVRTSGEVRLSDFLLWQSSYACLYFSTVYWPEVTIWNLLKAILCFQRNYGKIEEARKIYRADRQNRVIDHLQRPATGPKYAGLVDSLLERDERIDRFMDYLDNKENLYLKGLISAS